MRNKFGAIGVFSIVLILVSFILTGTSLAIGIIDNATSTIESIVGAIAILSGLTGVILGLSSLSNFKLENIKCYFTEGDKPEIADFRKPIYVHYNQVFLSKDGNDIQTVALSEEYTKAVSKIASFYHLWGMLAKKHYLPLWPFESSSGISIIKLFQGSIDHIVEKRKENPLYAEYFEEFYNIIIKEFGNKFSSMNNVNINTSITIESYLSDKKNK